jgi:hypothetical protein
MDLDYIHFSNSIREKKGLQDESSLEKMPDGSSYPFVYKGDGAWRFEDMSQLWGTSGLKGYFNGAAYADFDNDGRLDLVVNAIDAPAILLKNTAPRKNFIAITFKGQGLNTTGIGAKAYVFQKGMLQYQQLMLTRGFESSSDARLHFGLQDRGTIDSLLVVWPDQRYQLLKDVKANQQLVFSQANASGTFDYNSYFKPANPYFEILQDSAITNFSHKENDFNDFNVQYLIPHAQSTRGPKIAVADVNGDGLDDFYACGAKEQPGTLQMQQQNGTFIPSDEKTFKPDARSEDVDALFFDANGDGAPDLYVVSGGNEITGNNPMLLDRLYLNDGKGHFKKAADALPPLFENKSCVTAADFDKDGDADLFVGHLAHASAYGIPQTSYLQVNNGNGHFDRASENTIPLSQIGLVTSAAFADINKDGWTDLVVAGEWMPITVFINNAGRFQKTSIPHSTGWWQCLYVDDVNRDGQPDILAGNWGWNNKFTSGKNGPVKLYVSDFDKNGRTDQLLAYTLDGKEYPFLAKDEMERALPVLRKHYLRYAEYAGLPMEKVFYGYMQTVTPLQAERLGSAVCYGNGDGTFTIKDLPPPLQLAPIFSFQKIKDTAAKENRYLCSGNFFEVLPYEGRYDAQPLALFTSTNDNRIIPIPQTNLAAVKGQFRDLKPLRSTTYGHLIVAASNNGNTLFLKH